MLHVSLVGRIQIFLKKVSTQKKDFFMVSRETSERWETRKSSKEQTWAKNNGTDSVTVPVGINLSAVERKIKYGNSSSLGVFNSQTHRFTLETKTKTGKLRTTVYDLQRQLCSLYLPGDTLENLFFILSQEGFELAGENVELSQES